MAKASWNGVILAASDHCVVLEGNQYFPPESVNRRYLEQSGTRTTCAWKGEASYYHVVVDGKRNEDAGWYYPQPRQAAQQIKDHIAFWRGVKVEP
jgi:uncharacterized protein (DUF427 family)